jgi:hypothetical protein
MHATIEELPFLSKESVNKSTTIGVLLETVFLFSPAKKSSDENWQFQVSS